MNTQLPSALLVQRMNIISKGKALHQCTFTKQELQAANGATTALNSKELPFNLHSETYCRSVSLAEINKPAETGIMLQPVSHGHSHAPTGKVNSISSLAWMVIMGDGLHNLTDGLAIGAAFSGDTVAGFATALAVFCHELPHELGDFAILIKSGMSIRKALYYNIFSSVLSFIGMGFGVWIGRTEEAALWIYAATAGTFLYIALADLIPEMNQYGQQSKSFLGVILPMAGMITGGTIMLVIALYEHTLQSLFS